MRVPNQERGPWEPSRLSALLYRHDLVQRPPGGENVLRNRLAMAPVFVPEEALVFFN